MFSRKCNGNDKCYTSWVCEIRDLNILCSIFYVAYCLAPQYITSRARAASESWPDRLRRIKHQRNNDSHHIER